jgi:hypothetical protein
MLIKYPTLIIGFLLLILISCNSNKKISESAPPKPEITNLESDSIEYELLVFDPRFDTYLATLPYSKDYYSDQYYRSWILQYVTEWNFRQSDPIRYGDFYESHIDYNADIDYGLDLNFRLYHYFLFIEKEYGVVLIRRAKNSF